jgi:hypothetical protein
MYDKEKYKTLKFQSELLIPKLTEVSKSSSYTHTANSFIAIMSSCITNIPIFEERGNQYQVDRCMEILNQYILESEKFLISVAYKG